MTADVSEATRRYVEGIGRRKTAIARVRLIPDGTGVFLVNNHPWEKYFPTVDVQKAASDPLRITGLWGQLDVSAHVAGGGVHAQADAVKLGMARALLKYDEKLRKSLLRDTGMLTRDPRKKERKKPGLKRARRAPQWQKR